MTNKISPWFGIVLGSLMTLVGCVPQTTETGLPVSPPRQPVSTIASPQVGEFTSDQISGHGCGMTLWKASDRTSPQHFVLFHGLGDRPMELMLDGQITQFRRISAEGESFYGQQMRQTFENLDGTVTVTTEVTLGAPGEIESVAISAGTLIVTQAGQSTQIAVEGDAGC